MNIAVSANAEGARFDHYWSKCVGGGRANEGLRAGWQEQLKLVSETCGFKYVRFHGLFHDDMCVYNTTATGQVEYNWQYIDELFDRMLDLHVRPFVELSFCPGELASETETVFWWKAHGAPPKDLAQWEDLVHEFTHHIVNRYGLSEVRKWYFEVWNEPNHAPFFKGTRSQYFELYKASVNAVKRVDRQLRIGGPATGNFVADARFDGEQENPEAQITWKTKNLEAWEWKGVWIDEFLDCCSQNRLPLDFLSTHPYPTDFGVDEKNECRGRTRSVDSTFNDLTWLRNKINNSPFKSAEIHCTEWSSSPSCRDFSHDYPQAASFIVKTNLDSIGLVNSLSYWTFTDIFEETGAGPTVFHGGSGLVNLQGIVKPSFHAYRFLGTLGDELLQRGPAWVVTRDAVSSKLAILLTNYPEEVKEAAPMCPSRSDADGILGMGKNKEVFIALRDLRPNSVFEVEILDANHGWAMKPWMEMGEPEPPNREELDYLKSMALTTKSIILKADDAGSLAHRFKLQPWGVLFMREMGRESKR